MVTLQACSPLTVKDRKKGMPTIHIELNSTPITGTYLDKRINHILAINKNI
uniref:Uncharacterized protein n=1 Tax=Arion vulgaris TaxID=1028688 RepID=A0A0B7BWA2_9EUPU